MKSKRKQRKLRNWLGMIVGKSFYEDAKCGVLCFPDVHWEGNGHSSGNHPANIVPYRAGVKLPMIEYED
jgi:hypothetical protein